MKENLKGKDVLINDLVLRMEVVEGKQDAFEKEDDKADSEIDKKSDNETPVSEAHQNTLVSSDKQVKETETEKSKDEKVFECDICTYKTKSENGIKIHKTKKHTHTCRCCNQTFTDQELYSNHIGKCYSTYSYYDSPMMSPGRFPPRFPPRYPHTSPQRYPPAFPPHFPRIPLY
jgi:hypothetical protein